MVLKGGDQPVRDLFPAFRRDPAADSATRRFVNAVNRQHRQRTGEDAVLEARIRSYELAAKMQLLSVAGRAAEAVSVS